MIKNKLCAMISSLLVITTCSGMKKLHQDILTEACRVQLYRDADEKSKVDQDTGAFNLVRSDPIWSKAEKFFPNYEFDEVMGFIETCQKIRVMRALTPYHYYHLAAALMYIYDNRNSIENCIEEINNKGITVLTKPAYVPQKSERYDDVFSYREYLELTKDIYKEKKIRKEGYDYADQKLIYGDHPAGIFRHERKKLFPDRVFSRMVMSSEPKSEASAQSDKEINNHIDEKLNSERPTGIFRYEREVIFSQKIFPGMIADPQPKTKTSAQSNKEKPICFDWGANFDTEKPICFSKADFDYWYNYYFESKTKTPSEEKSKTPAQDD